MLANHSFKPKSALITLLLLGHSQGIWAADAGQQLNQIERILDQKQPLRTPPTIEQEKPVEKPSQEGFRFSVKHFVFEGNHLFSANQLEAYLKDYLNREITFDELKLAVDSISLYYKDRAYLATASLPKQDISEGEVKVQIVEAQYGGAKIDGEAGVTYQVDPEIIKRFIEANNPPDQVLKLDTLDRAILIANELPGVAVSQSLRAGDKEGQAESLVKISNTAAYAASISSDNYGFLSTGRQRYLAAASLFSPLNIGDRIDFSYMHTTGNDYARAGFNRPIGYSGLSLGINASALKYDVIEGAGLSLKPAGNAQTISLAASYPSLRGRNLNITSNAALEIKHYKNTSSNGLESDYKVDLFTIGSSLGHRNSLTLAGQTSASLDLDLGYADYGNSPASFRAGKISQEVEGRFARLRWNLNNTQFYTQTISSVIKFNGQLADSNLDSSQKFYLGGATGVRAYPSSEGGGSDGLLVNLELHKELPADLSLVGFYDYGLAKEYVNNTNKLTHLPNATGQNGFNMNGYGASLEWKPSFLKLHSSISLVWSKRIGDNPKPQADGTDSDGTRHDNFYWINASINLP